MRSVQELLVLALSRSPDLSPDLQAEVAELARAVSVAIGGDAAVRLATDYSVSHMIESALDQHGRPVGDLAERRYLLRVAVSLVAPAWTLFLYELTAAGRSWVPYTEPMARVVARDVLREIDRLMAESGRSFVAPVALDELVAGAQTELDGAPATVRDILFCELC